MAASLPALNEGDNIGIGRGDKIVACILRLANLDANAAALNQVMRGGARLPNPHIHQSERADNFAVWMLLSHSCSRMTLSTTRHREQA
jgi:hypothetical protein